jgi:hypothetical protein
MKLRKSLTLLVLLGCLANTACRPRNAEATIVDPCEVFANPHRHGNQVRTIRGVYYFGEPSIPPSSA